MVASIAISLLALLAAFVPQNVVYAQRHTPSVLLGSNGSVAIVPHLGKHSSGVTAFELALNPHRLLFPRQGTGCPSGYAPCAGDPTSCCPVGGACCISQDGCCPRGEFCYSTGCCDDGEFGCSGNTCCPRGSTCCSGGGCCASGSTCVVIGGSRGCCPIGRTCTGTGSGCSIASDVPCPGEDFCCPRGDTCGRDSSGEPACLSGGGPPPPPPPPPPGTTSSTRPPPPTPTFTSQVITFRPTTTTSVGGGAAPSQSAAIFTQSFPPAPTAGASVQNETVGATDPRISYQGDWGTGTTCQGASRRATETESSLRFQFVGTAVFMNTLVGPNAGVFHASIDGTPTEVDGFTKSTSTDCDITWSQWGLTRGLHTVEVVYRGASRAATSSASAGIEFSNFIITTDATDPGTVGSSSGAMPLSSPQTFSGWLVVVFSPVLAALALV